MFSKRSVGAALTAVAVMLSSVLGQTPVGPRQPINPIPILSGGTTTVDPNAFITSLAAPLNHEEDSRYDLEDRNRALLHSGEFVSTHEDFKILGRGMDIEWERTYRSRIRYSGPFGENWTFRYNVILRESGNQAIYYNWDGKPSEFYWNGVAFVPTNGVNLLLTKLADNSFTLKFPSSHVYAFSAANGAGRARLMSITDQNENVISFGYDANERLINVVDTLGRSINLTYFSTGRVKEVVDSTGRTWRFGYDASDNLVTVVTPGTPDAPSGYFSSYTYSSGTGSVDLDHNMLTFTPPAGLRFSSTYDALDQMITHSRGNGSWNVSYGTGTGNRTVTVFDRNGNQSDFSINAAHTLTASHSYANRGINPFNPTSWTWQYAAGGGGVSTTSLPDGRIQSVTKDAFNPDILARSNVLEEREHPVPGSGLADRVRRTVYEPFFNEPKLEVDSRAFPSGVVPLIGGQLDVSHPLVQKYAVVHYFDYEEVQNSIDYNGDGVLGPWHGNVVKTVYPTATVHGSAFTADPPQSAEVFYVWNSRGQLIEERSAGGHATRYYYWPSTDPIGANPATQPVSDLTTLCGYEAMRVVDWTATATIDPATGAPHLNLATKTKWNAWGHRIETTDPRQNTTVKTVDALGRVTKVVGPAPLSHEITWNYNGNSQATKMLVKNVLASGALDTANPWIETRYTWNSVDRLVEAKEEVGEGIFATTKAFYDKNDRRVLIISPLAVAGTDDGNVVSYVYDELDHVASKTSGGTTAQFKSLAAHSHIDLNGLGIQDSAAIGTMLLTTNFDGIVVRESDPVGRISTTSLDGYGRATVSTDGAGNSFVTALDEVDQVVGKTILDSTGSQAWVETFVLDERKRVVENFALFFNTSNGSPILLDGNHDGWTSRCIAYDTDDRPVKSADDRGRVSTTSYDGAGRRTKALDSNGNGSIWSYDANGNVVGMIRRQNEAGVPVNYTESFAFDVADRMVSSTDASGKTTTFAVNSRGLATAVVDPLGNEVLSTYDGRGRLLTESRPIHQGGVGSGAVIATSTISRVYDLNGNLTEVRDGQNSVTTLTYDSRNRLVDQHRPGELHLTLGYFPDDRIAQVVDPRGTQVAYGYDGAGNNSSRSISVGPNVDPQTTFELIVHDAMGRVVSATNNTFQVTRTYDSLGNILTDSHSGYTARQEVDANGNQVSVTYPSGLSVLVGVDPTIDQPSTVALNGQPYFGFTYLGDARLDVRTTTPPGGASWELKRTYDGGMRLAMHRHRWTGTNNAIAGWTLSRTDTGNVATVLRAHAGGTGDQYFYDSLDEQVRVNRGVPRTQLPNFLTTAFTSFSTYEFDLAYNRTTANENGVVTSYVANGLQQYSQVGTAVLNYDPNGNLVSDGSKTYSYDYAGRLVRVDQGGSPIATMIYDVLGRRVVKTTSSKSVHSIHLGDEVLEEIETVGASTTTRQMVWGKTIDDLMVLRVGSTDYFPIDDQQNSVAYLLNAQGAVVESYTYDSYGAPTIKNASGVQIASSAFGNSWMYAGRTWDAEIGLYYNRARYLSPTLGRFITRDPIGFAGGINLYAYTMNSPINGTDPFGKDKFEDLVPPDNTSDKASSLWTIAGGVATVVGGTVAIATSGGLALIPILAALGTQAGGVIVIVEGTVSYQEASQEFMDALGKSIDSFADNINQGVRDGVMMCANVGNKPGTYDLGAGYKVTVHENGTKTAEWPDGSKLTINKDGSADGHDGHGNIVHVDSDGTITTTLEDGTTIVRHRDGSTTTTTKDGVVIKTDRNGNVVHTRPKKKKEEEKKDKEESKTKPTNKTPTQY